MRCAQGTIFVSSADELIYSFNADDGDNVTIIGRDKAKSCVLRGFLNRRVLALAFEGLGFRYECVGRFCGVSIWAWKALARRYLGGRRGRRAV
jgi:hypothetical protein